MKNTVLKNIISNFDLMANDHFIEWFKENKEVLLEKEKDQIINSYCDGRLSVITKEIISYEQYYQDTFGRNIEAGI
jgi:hypothetical protein